MRLLNPHADTDTIEKALRFVKTALHVSPEHPGMGNDDTVFWFLPNNGGIYAFAGDTRQGDPPQDADDLTRFFYPTDMGVADLPTLERFFTGDNCFAIEGTQEELLDLLGFAKPAQRPGVAFDAPASPSIKVGDEVQDGRMIRDLLKNPRHGKVIKRDSERTTVRWADGAEEVYRPDQCFFWPVCPLLWAD